jgi:hypothetical protein
VPSSRPPTPATTTGEMLELPTAMTWKVALKMPCSTPATSKLAPSVYVQAMVGMVPDALALAMKVAVAAAVG